MSVKVREFMNPELVYLREGSRPDIALQPMLDFGITAVPVLDEDGHPVGVVSLRALVQRDQKPRMEERVPSVRADETMENAARMLAESGAHHLVVVSERGRAIGMLSSLDALRALVGMAPEHPIAISSFGSNGVSTDAPRS